MMRPSAVVNRFPLTFFAILTYVLSWSSIPFADGGLLPHGPFLAAIILISITAGRAGLVRYFRRLVALPSRWYWLLIAPGLVAAYLLVAAGMNALLGAVVSSTDHLNGFGGTLLMLLLLGGLWEEPGWTGYALPLLQERYASRGNNQLLASLHVGALRAFWHLPLVISGAIPWYDVVFFSFALQFLITWLYNRTGSVPAVMLLHLASNLFGGSTMLPLYTGADHTQYYVIFIAVAWVLALLLTRPNNWSMGRAAARR